MVWRVAKNMALVFNAAESIGRAYRAKSFPMSFRSRLYLNTKFLT